jgi:hypothetical protein
MNEFPHTLIRIAVWNLAGFNPINPSTGIPQNSERIKKQAEGIALLDAELMTLVEVSPIEHIDRLVNELSNFGVNYTSKILPQPNGNIHIGFLHKPGVEVDNLELLAGSEGDDDGGRQALFADVECEKFKAKIIGVHFKSGRDAPEQRIRDSQCKIVSEKIDEIRSTPGLTQRTILLMGDFNMIPGQDVSNFHHLGGDDVMDFVSCWDLQDRFSHILEKGRANLLDGFAVSRTFSTDYVRGSLRLFPMHWTMDMGREKFKDEVSDHLPFVASFRIF